MVWVLWWWWCVGSVVWWCDDDDDDGGDYWVSMCAVDSAFKAYRANTVFHFAAERQADMAKYVVDVYN